MYNLENIDKIMREYANKVLELINFDNKVYDSFSLEDYFWENDPLSELYGKLFYSLLKNEDELEKEYDYSGWIDYYKNYDEFTPEAYNIIDGTVIQQFCRAIHDIVTTVMNERKPTIYYDGEFCDETLNLIYNMMEGVLEEYYGKEGYFNLQTIFEGFDEPLEYILGYPSPRTWIDFFFGDKLLSLK